jgi:hypothetical protein
MLNVASLAINFPTYVAYNKCKVDIMKERTTN